jgi:GNAT superfamily N-acetyltransferase
VDRGSAGKELYRIREVDASDNEVAETIREFNKLEAWPELTDEELDGDDCHWWFAYDELNNPIAFSGLNPSRLYQNAGYFKRVGVLSGHRGNRLQVRFFRALEQRARRIGWNLIVSETTNTIYSANNFIRCGYRLFEPTIRWAFQNSLYWRKDL